ncbi:MAG: hypothetical protein HKM04_07115 [Legionellales bacterium]|nr:hypothetical protein [Legionellales bacterium]
MVAEGVETGLSIAQANPDKKVIATLSISNFNNIILPEETKNIIICADNDKGKEHAIASLATAIERFQAQGKAVSVAFPTMGEQQINADGLVKKVDFNDVHQLLGIDTVKAQTSQAERIETKEKTPESDNQNVLKNLFGLPQNQVVSEQKLDKIDVYLMRELNRADEADAAKTPSLTADMERALNAIFSPDNGNPVKNNSIESLFYPSENPAGSHQKSHENDPEIERNRSDFSSDHTEDSSPSVTRSSLSKREKAISAFLPVESQKTPEAIIERN